MKSIPRIKIAHLPTPVELLPRLSAALEGPQLLVKRDDQTGLAFGGNKTRKLEFLLAEAQANGARMLITGGADQSNHCRQTAAAAARHGFECTLVLTYPEGGNEGKADESLATGNLMLNRLFGAEIVWTQRSNRDNELQRIFQHAWEQGKRPYLIPYGGSNSTGAAAYSYALGELMDQNLIPDWIVVPSSSGGTQAGLVLGSKVFDFKGNILGISVDEPAEMLKSRVASLANDTADLLGENHTFSPGDIMVVDDCIGKGYGVVSEVERDAIQLFAHSEGLLLDPVYTGRAAGGMINLIRSGYFDPHTTVLFWHTGGTPAIFADRYMDIL
jgi:D-cysteine desulfhydrase family pyridoxal phosphate-dependent enzyme